MKAPDKAYIAAQWHADDKTAVLYASYEKTSHPHEEVFIRKEALLGWAYEQICLNPFAAGIRALIDKLNTM